MFQKTVTNLLLIILLILLGYILGVYIGPPGYSSLDKESLRIDSVIVEKESRDIDSLLSVIKDYEIINNRLRDSIQVVVTTRIIEVDAVKKLPLDSGVIFLKQKLGEFENR